MFYKGPFSSFTKITHCIFLTSLHSSSTALQYVMCDCTASCQEELIECTVCIQKLLTESTWCILCQTLRDEQNFSATVNPLKLIQIVGKRMECYVRMCHGCREVRNAVTDFFSFTSYSTSASTQSKKLTSHSCSFPLVHILPQSLSRNQEHKYSRLPHKQRE